MKSYRSIDGPSAGQHRPCYGFVKYDGSNLRFEWSKKRGWYKFGTRKTMFDRSSEIFGTSIDLFLAKYGDDLEKIFKKEKHFRHVQSIVVFCEWFGAKSFAGNHKPWDKKDIVLFDVNLHKKGLMGPKEFLRYFGHLDVAEIVFRGNFGPQLVENVRNKEIDIESKYEIKSEIPEGIICKGGKGHDLWMCKIKTADYMGALKVKYESDWSKYWE